MYKGGRNLDSVWQYFHRLSIDGKIVAKCKQCGHIQSNKAARMKTHVSNCVKKPSSQCVEETPSCSKSEDRNYSNSCLNSLNNEEVDQPPVKIQCLDHSNSNITKFVSKTKPMEKMKIDLAVAKMFYACNIPFAVVESDSFKNLIHILRPSYEPPSRKELADSLLDAVHSEMEGLVAANLKGKEGTLIIDGWSNIHNEPIIASCIKVNEKSYIVDVENTGTTKKSAEFLSAKCSEIIGIAKEKYDCEVKSIVSDNAKNMEKMRCQLEEKSESEGSTLITYGCAAHWLNLLGQDITPSSITKHVTDIHKYFRNHHAPGAWLKECNDHVSPQLPVLTRWSSQLTCFETFIRNHTSYVKITNEHHDELDSNIVARIRDFNLYQQVKDLISQLKPIASALAFLESDSANIADACHMWCNLLRNEELKPHSAIVKKRFEQAISHWHLVAYLLHPKYRGENLNYEQKEKARAFLQKINPSFVTNAINFELKEAPFPVTHFEDQVIKTIDGSKWWRSIAKACDISKDFCQLAAHLQTCPSSSAAIERIFSNFAFVHSKTRNRLGIDKVLKLVYCYLMLKLQNMCPDSIEIDDEIEFDEI